MSRRFTLIITIFGITLRSAGVVWLTNSQAISDPTGLAHTTPQGPGLERYVDPVGGYFFDYPAGLKVTVTDDGESRYIFGDTPEGETHFLISVYPSPVTELTEDYLQGQSFAADFNAPFERRELPSYITAFISGRNDTPLGLTRDAFFVTGANAYQVSVAANFPELLEEILQTWLATSPRAL
jgi:hypothetical protein